MLNFNFLILYLTFAIIFSLFIVFYAQRNPQGRAARSFAITAFTSVLWMSGDLVERLTSTFAGQWLGQSLCFLGVCFLPVAMLVFIYDYCNKNINRNLIITLCIVPTISWMMLVTNPFHYLFYSQIEFIPFAPAKTVYGTYFWFVHLPYCYILSLFGFGLVLTERQKAAPHYRPQISILLFSLSIPMTTNVLGIFKLIGDATNTTLTFPVFFSIMAVAVFRYRFLKSNPIAYETVFQTIQDGVIVLDLENVITDINPAAAISLGKTPKSIIGTSVKETFSPWQHLLTKCRDATDEIDLIDEIELELGGKKHFISVRGTPLRNHSGAVAGRIFTLRDITERKNYEFALENMAFYDPLTRLANRRRFEDEAARTLNQSARTGESVAILYFDLNRFKAINDTMGHAVGDELLKYVGARASSILRGRDLIARLGGDEFAVLLHNCDCRNIDLMIERILTTVERPFKVGKNIVTASLSIGAAFYPEDGTTVFELLQHADAAMYRTKHQSRNTA